MTKNPNHHRQVDAWATADLIHRSTQIRRGLIEALDDDDHRQVQHLARLMLALAEIEETPAERKRLLEALRGYAERRSGAL